MLSSYSQVIYILRKHKHVLQHKTTSPCSFSCSLFFCSMNPATYQTQRKSKTQPKLRATELFSSQVLLYLQNYLSLLKTTTPSLLYDLPPYYLFYLLHPVLFSTLPKIVSSSPSDFRSFLLKRSVASSRSFSKTFSADQIRSRIRRLSTLIEHASSMLAAAISIPAHSSKESHAIFMQY